MRGVSCKTLELLEAYFNTVCLSLHTERLHHHYHYCRDLVAALPSVIFILSLFSELINDLQELSGIWSSQ